jgi:hypothetical protein
MTTIANSTGLWQTFGYNFDDPNGHIQELSLDTQEHMNSMPAFVEEWQVQDIKNNDFGGYYKNPIQSVVVSIELTANLIYAAANTANGVTNMANVRSSALALANSARYMLAHTNRISGVTPFDGTDTNNPYLDMVLGGGRTAMYITYQTDGVVNNAPIMGSLTSLLIEPQLSANSNILITYKSNVVNSIVLTANVDTGIINATSNMSGTLITTINTHMTNLTDYMNLRRTSDINFYIQVKNFIDGYNKTKKLTNLGETGNYLMNDLIGTEKAKSRIG